MDRIAVGVRAEDPISEVGVACQLRPRPELSMVDTGGSEAPRVVVVVVDTIDENALRVLRSVQRTTTARIVLVATHLDDQQLVSTVEFGVTGVVRRTEATPERLVQVIVAVARGEGAIPADLLGRLLEQVGRVQRQVLGPQGLNFHGLAAREVEVLRLLADGHDTAEIARRLSYSERTIKQILHAVITRLQLRNRAHAVAYAMRQGVI